MFLKYTTLWVAAIFVGVGGIVFWSNPRRGVNRVVFATSVHIGLWLAVLNIAMSGPNRLSWLRSACAVSAFFPLHFFVAERTIAFGTARSGPGRKHGYSAWIVYSVLLAGLCFTQYFIPSGSTASHRLYGWGYYAYIVGAIGGYAAVLVAMLTHIRKVEGLQRLELEVWLLGGCTTGMAILASMALNAVTKNPSYVRVQPVLVLAFFSGTSYAITTHRIFDAWQILRLVMHRIALVAISSVEAVAVFSLLERIVPREEAFVGAVGVLAIFFGPLRRWVDRRFGYYFQEGSARNAVFDTARKEVRTDGLQSEFRKILMGVAHSDRAVVMSGPESWLSGSGMQLAGEDASVVCLRRLGWATPERLQRERESPERLALARLLEEHGLSVALMVQGPSVSVLSGAGRQASRRPYSYPQIKQLMDLAVMFQGPLERAHMAAKIQHAEQLATVGMLGASLAHEIRNPLVSLKSFVQLLPDRYHEEEFRGKFFRLMVEEVARIDRLTEQLLDLASPRAYRAQTFHLHSLIQSSLELVTPRAKDSAVHIQTALDAAPDRVQSDPSAIKQVIINLCLNAIQVLADRPVRQITVATRNGPDFIDLTVSDSGPGIAPEMRGRLFQPFQTGKSSGFGLGLVICRDILASLNAKIIVDPPQPDEGATFRVTIPCRP
ncbi:MAG: two-component system sensor histidine kinase NtrB [Opitutaceae bacterium]